jgi:thioredoxin reductase (NADPH)
MSEMIDCVIVGGGPAGLTAAIYGARYRLKVQVVDRGDSRSSLIACTRNVAGFPDGIAGAELLTRMRRQALLSGALLTYGDVTRIRRRKNGFVVKTSQGEVTARTVLLATGITSNRPMMTDDLHSAAVLAHRLGYCPVCDGYEATDKTVGVIGTGEHGANEALFLRSYTQRVTLIAPNGRHKLTEPLRRKLRNKGVAVNDGPANDFELNESGLNLSTASGRHAFDMVYPALGSVAHSGLASSLGAATTKLGCIKVDNHQRTTVPGLYAAGDVVVGLDQISHAMGEGGVAATAIRNELDAQRPILR